MLTLHFKKSCFNLFASTVVIFALFGLRAYSNDEILFDSSQFQVNHLDTSNIGFEYLGAGQTPGSHRYRLTTADTFQTIAMWHTGGINGNTLDMASEWVFNFRLHFGNGRVTKFFGGNIL